jgi:hypothetical protein
MYGSDIVLVERFSRSALPSDKTGSAPTTVSALTNAGILMKFMNISSNSGSVALSGVKLR